MADSMVKWATIVRPLLDLFLEATCPLCQRSTPGDLCQDCEQQLQACRLAHPGNRWQGDLPVFGWGVYGGKLKRAIAALKYEHHPELARPLGHWVGHAWRHSQPLVGSQSRSQPVVVPIPLHISKLKQRGFNQAELLARSFCEQTGLACCAQGLERIRATEAQFGLAPAARSQNVAAAFALGPGLKGKTGRSVLLFDDIYTTGATAQAATQAIRQAGIEVIGIAVLAITQGEQRQ